MSSTIDGKPTKPIPAGMAAAMKRGTPKRTAASAGAKPVSTVKVK